MEAHNEPYESDDPMLIVLQDPTPIDNPIQAAKHFCKLLPSLFKFHCRACCGCCKEMDCVSGFVVLLPFLSGLIGIVTGVAVGAGVVFRDGYYDYYGWHNARDAGKYWSGMRMEPCSYRHSDFY